MNKARIGLLLLVLCLAACGKRPADVGPPSGYPQKDGHAYPRTYPAVSPDSLSESHP